MKKLILAFLAAAMVLAGVNASAQGKYGKDSAECIKYLSYYKDYFKQKSYDDALPNWRKAFKLCPPTASQNMLLDGSTLIRNLIRSEKDAATRKGLIDTLLSLHDIRAQYYPTYAVTALNNKGLDASNLLKDDPEKLYSVFQEVIAANKEQTRPSLLLLNMDATIKRFNEGKLTTDDVLKTYENSLALLEKAPVKTDADAEQRDNARSDLEGLFITSKVASCQDLLALFTPRFEANPNDMDLVNNIVKMLAIAEDCTDNDLFLKAVTAMYNNNPSASAAYYLYRLNNSRNNTAAAVKYLEEAIESPETDAATDAGYLFELATVSFKNGNNGKAVDAATRAANLDSSYLGKSYYLIGTIWGSTKCGGGYIGSRAPYWVAVDYLHKAKSADPSLTEDCNRLIGQYSAYFPQKAEAFMYDVTDGQSYTVACGGMRATTTVRTQN
ncbi:MAG: hypothetical protein IJK96_04800 [Bacteroidales bacterium]|nr:hypothetical protein [Bacteroidales bacterium]